MNKTLTHDLIGEPVSRQVVFIGIGGEDNNSHDPTLLHDIINLGLLLLFCFMTLQETLSVFELASAAGLRCNIDPALVTAITSMLTGNARPISALPAESSGSESVVSSCNVVPADNTTIDEEYKLSSLLLVYVAVSLPSLALDTNSSYSREHGGSYSFIHFNLLQPAWQWLVSRQPSTTSQSLLLPAADRG